jgi:hypothetical protein
MSSIEAPVVPTTEARTAPRDEERPEEDQEGDVLVGDVTDGRRVQRPHPGRDRETKQRAQDGLVAVVLPQVPRHEGQHGDAEEHEGERRHAPERQCLSDASAGGGGEDGLEGHGRSP